MRAVMVLTQCFSLRRRSFRDRPGVSAGFSTLRAVGRCLTDGRPCLPVADLDT